MKFKDIFLSSFLFFLVLSSWYVIRSVRNEIAVENYSEDFLLILLSSTAIVMIFANSIYSWVVSKSNFIKIISYSYSFLISNLILFLVYSKFLTESDSIELIWLGRIFYVWANVYSFFVVAIFWVLIINIYRDVKSRKFYGFIMAGGSLGAIFGSEISVRLSETFMSSRIELFVLSSSILLFLAMLLAIYIAKSKKSFNVSEVVGGKWSDSFNNVVSSNQIRSIAIYSWLFTGLMTIQWISAIPIIESYSELSSERIVLFGRIEQLVSPITLITQIFFTYIVISIIGIKLILIFYGILFALVFFTYGFYPSVGVVIFAQLFLRVFEYGFNKPSREIVYSELDKNNRYKSSVFIDTFISRFGDLSGSIFMGIGKFFGIAISFMPLIALPVTFIFSLVGMKISKNKNFKNL